MRTAALLLSLCVGLCLPNTAAAVPVTGLDVLVELTARVRAIEGGGTLYGSNGEVRRTFDVSELPQSPWNVGDVLTLRWELEPNDVLDCAPGSENLLEFGGVSGGALPVVGCNAGGARFAQINRADGGVLTREQIRDGFESGFGTGPIVDLQTGDIQLIYETVDGLVLTDCCFYSYDEVNDAITFTPGEGFFSDSPAFLFGGADPGTGSGMYMFASRPGEGTRLEGSFFVEFDVNWRTRFVRVPEPGALALAGFGLVAAGLMGRRSRRR